MHTRWYPTAETFLGIPTVPQYHASYINCEDISCSSRILCVGKELERHFHNEPRILIPRLVHVTVIASFDECKEWLGAV